MIQPVSNFIPRPVFRGSDIACGKSLKKTSDSQVAILNACGAGIAIGGLTAAIARSHTSSWANAVVLGMFGTFLSLFFMTPQIIKNKSQISDVNCQAKNTSVFFKKDLGNFSGKIKNGLKPAKKVVQFGQN